MYPVYGQFLLAYYLLLMRHKININGITLTKCISFMREGIGYVTFFFDCGCCLCHQIHV